MWLHHGAPPRKAAGAVRDRVCVVRELPLVRVGYQCAVEAIATHIGDLDASVGGYLPAFSDGVFQESANGNP
jgi:hypothetical protein